MNRYFEVVSDKFRKTNGEITLPTRATKSSIAYDFYSPVAVTIPPMQSVMIWTDVKVHFNGDEALLLNVRSSMGKHPVMIANTQGWIESDYCHKQDHEGIIGCRLLNLGTEPYVINVGDRIMQGMFIKYLVADNGNTDNTRQGGFGSSGK